MALLLFSACFGGLTEEVTSGGRPHLFHSDLTGPLPQTDGQVLGIAHNAGNHLRSAQTALAHGAPAIEIDVVLVDGELRVAHVKPLPWIGEYVFRGPTLASAWDAAGDAALILLDLNGSSAEYIRLLLDFLAERTGKDVAIITGDPGVLAAFQSRMPHVRRFFDARDRADLLALQANQHLANAIDGLTVPERLIDRETVQRLKGQGLLIAAWVVNDLDRVNQLIDYGVDAITTDNLAVLERLGTAETGRK
jgi:glycerophosphoryl diester phosphodiesterase